ncbi:MFS transporter [Paraburkholderia terrae]|uniref:MFS transporter n=1 Tax=Paraburkholderia terrae TaxID=311230 RepID=UPI0020833CC0|nr:hypothetical protein CBA19C8_11110 [Paraburkholderia terrae]
MLLGFLLAIVFYFPIFHGLTKFANPTLYAAQESAPVTVVADPTSCSFQFNPVGTSSFSKSCDIAKSFLARSAVNYSNENAPAGTVAYVRVGNTRIDSVDIAGVGNKEGAKQVRDFEAKLGTLIKSVGYPTIADPKLINYPMVLLMLIGLVLTVAMVYGPIAATLVELFPTRIRYTAMSLPYHIGNGWFGGFLPTTAFALVAATGNIYAGVWYPVVIAAVSLVIGFFFLPETRQRHIID